MKPLFIRSKVENIGIKKVIVDGGACINILPHYLLRKIDKFYIDLKPHNMVMPNYEGKTSKTLGVI